MLALSTSWNNAARRPGAALIAQARNLGFQSLELAFSHTKKQFAHFLASKDITISSLHNYCPVPDGIPRQRALPDCFSLASTDASERKKAVAFTKRTIRSAQQCKARAVVLHCGRVEMRDRTKELVRLKEQKKDFRAFNALKEKICKEREQKKMPYIDAVLASLKELSAYAHNHGILLGVENRIYLREIPNFSEIKMLVEPFLKKGVGYWHDTGHAYILEKLGFTGHLEYLQRHYRYLLGIHLHDVDGFKDHRVPFTGEINFSSLKPFVKKETIKVLEVHQPVSNEALIFAKEKLEQLLN